MKKKKNKHDLQIRFSWIALLLGFTLTACLETGSETSSISTTATDEVEVASEPPTETADESIPAEENTTVSDNDTDTAENFVSETAAATGAEEVIAEAVVAPSTVEPAARDLSTCAMDIHMHFAANVAFSVAAAQLLEQMMTLEIGDSVGLNFALLEPPPSPCPTCSDTEYTYEDDKSPSLERIIDNNPTKFALIAGGGELSPTIDEAVRNGTEPSESELAAFRQSAGAIINDGALGFGEMAVLHLSYAADHPFIEIPADHAYFLALAEVAATRGVPLDIHLEAINQESFVLTRDMPTSCFLTVEAGGNNPVTLQENITAFKTLLTHNYDTAVTEGDAGKAKIVWSHVGWDNTGHLSVALIRELMAAHPNLIASLKMLDDVHHCQVVANRPLDANGNLQDEWLQLFEAYPDRFVLGADEFIGTETSDSPGSPSLQGTWNLIAKLSDDLACKFACENPRRIYGVE